MRIVSLLLTFQLTFTTFSLAQESSEGALSLKELLGIGTTVAGITETSGREAPGIVTILTEQEIRNSGARDLADLLRFVPGFEFGVDVQGVVGLGMRGNWGHEGKILLLIDGQEYNEPLFSTLQFGNHFPVSNIKTIEIIRGPGSAIYGGYAELAVIRITTKKGQDLSGVQASAFYEQMSGTYARRGLDLALGKKVGEWILSANAIGAQGNRSGKTFTDLLGDSYDMQDNSKLDLLNAGVKAAYKGLSLQFTADQYKTTMRDGFGGNLERAARTDFPSYFATAGYSAQLKDNLKLEAKLNYRHQKPWLGTDPILQGTSIFFETSVQRLNGGLTAIYDPSEDLNLVLGTEVTRDSAKRSERMPDDRLFDGKRTVDYTNLAAFGQGIYKTPIVNIIAGARFESHDQYGESFVPRLGLTKLYNRFNFKALFSRAFRAPAIENINLNPTIEPEKTTVLELEAGYQITDDMFIKANAYDIKIEKAIVYTYDEILDRELYANFPRTGTRGVEIEYLLRRGRMALDANYSYYQANQNKVDLYAVEGDEKSLLAFPRHKLNLRANFEVSEQFALSSTATYMSKRAAYIDAGVNDQEILGNEDPLLLWSLTARWKNVLKSGIEAEVGAYDILGQDYRFAQPYDGFHAPIPDAGREVSLRLAYRFNFAEN